MEDLKIFSLKYLNICTENSIPFSIMEHMGDKFIKIEDLEKFKKVRGIK